MKSGVNVCVCFVLAEKIWAEESDCVTRRRHAPTRNLQHSSARVAPGWPGRMTGVSAKRYSRRQAISVRRDGLFPQRRTTNRQHNNASQTNKKSSSRSLLFLLLVSFVLYICMGHIQTKTTHARDFDPSLRRSAIGTKNPTYILRVLKNSSKTMCNRVRSRESAGKKKKNSIHPQVS